MLKLLNFLKSMLFIFTVNIFFVNTYSNAIACTRILNANNGQAVLVGRTMDWYKAMHDKLWVYPRGIRRSGMANVNSLRWTSHYGSIVAISDFIPTDGMNEKGLASHMLWLGETDYGKRNENILGLSVMFWAQFYLDNFATVAEAIRYTKENSFQIVPEPALASHLKMHLALEDASGDSAIIESINGVMHIYHGQQYSVLTNSPTLDRQIINMQQYQGLGGYKPLPGTTEPEDRFVRSAYYNSHWIKPHTLREALTEMLSVIQNVSEPYGIENPESLDLSPTLWRVVADLTNHVYYFNSSTSFYFIWIKLDKFNLLPGSHVMSLELSKTRELSGDVAKYFEISTDIQRGDV